jgi:hypothetical protein
LQVPAAPAENSSGLLNTLVGAQAMRPYPRISWGLLANWDAENLHFVKNLNIEF